MTGSLLQTWLLMLAMGLFGSLHCIGMCGGLVSAVCMQCPRSQWSGLWAYQTGRLTTYALLGLVVGISGVALQALAADMLQRGLALFAGLAMVVFALNLAGWLPDPLRRLSAAAGRLTGLARLARQIAEGQRTTSWYLLGLANGLLPCGLVYAALALALARADALESALMMTGFGLGTVPAMMFVPWLLRRLTTRMRLQAMRLSALMLLILAAMTIMRGMTTMGHA